MRKQFLKAALVFLTIPVFSQDFDSKKLIQDIQVLSHDSLQGRKAGTEGSFKAQRYLEKRFSEAGIEKWNGQYQQKFTFNDKANQPVNATNIVGIIKGKKNPEKYIIITAHYDHLGQGKGDVYNGADDNASGIGGMLAVASHYKKNKPNNSIIFIACDAEEMGLMGAKHFVSTLPFKKENVVINLNFDMISRNEQGELYICGTSYSPYLKTIIEKVKETDVKIKYGHDKADSDNPHYDWTMASDHGPFHSAGIPFVYFGVEDHNDYHQPSDEFAKIDQKFYVNAVRYIVKQVRNFDANSEVVLTSNKAN